MSQKIIIGVIVLALIIFGFLAFSGKKTEDVKKENTSNQALNETTGNQKKISFSDFIEQDGSYKCQISQDISGSKTSGTVYINNGQIKGEFASSYQGTEVKTNFLQKEGFSYSWNSMTNTGFKVPIPKEVETSQQVKSDKNSFNPDSIGDYNCADWVLDKSQFDLPTTIKFTEITR